MQQTSENERLKMTNVLQKFLDSIEKYIVPREIGAGWQIAFGRRERIASRLFIRIITIIPMASSNWFREDYRPSQRKWRSQFFY